MFQIQYYCVCLKVIFGDSGAAKCGVSKLQRTVQPWYLGQTKSDAQIRQKGLQTAPQSLPGAGIHAGALARALLLCSAGRFGVWSRSDTSMVIGVPKETFPLERRVSQTPESVEKLVQAGFQVRWSPAPAPSTFGDEMYKAVGAEIVGRYGVESRHRDPSARPVSVRGGSARRGKFPWTAARGGGSSSRKD